MATTRCPKGTRKNKKTGNCEKSESKKTVLKSVLRNSKANVAGTPAITRKANSVNKKTGSD